MIGKTLASTAVLGSLTLAQAQLEDRVDLREKCAHLFEVLDMDDEQFDRFMLDQIQDFLEALDAGFLIASIKDYLPDVVFFEQCLHFENPFEGQPGWVYGTRLRRPYDLRATEIDFTGGQENDLD